MAGIRDPSETLEMSELASAQDLSVPALTVIGHPDPRRVSAWVALGPRVELGRSGPTFDPHGGLAALPLQDPFISRQPVLLEEKPGGDWLLDASQTKTVLEVDGELVEGSTLVEAARLETGVVLCLSGRVALLLHLQTLPRPHDHARLDLVGHSRAIEGVRRNIEQVAPLDVPVLIRGESGVGKELVAQAIHTLSARKAGPYEVVNMAAIPANLAAAELFGAEKGAFTGADSRREGFFSRTDKGTLFLDEVGDTPLEVQPQLLRALETHDIRAVGAAASKTIDVRVISATDARLEDAVRKETFRDALLHRLAGFQIVVPPLRERREDIGLLLLTFLRRELETLGKAARLDAEDQKRPWLSAHVVARLARYDWPGNVRQLRNVARQLAIRGAESTQLVLGPELEALLPTPTASLPPEPAGSGPQPVPPLSDSFAAPTGSGAFPAPTGSGAYAAPAPTPSGTMPAPAYVDPADISPEQLLETLRAHAFRVAPAAKALGLSRTSMYALIEQSPHIRKAADLTAQQIEAAFASSGGNLTQAAAQLEVSAHALKLRMTALGLRR